MQEALKVPEGFQLSRLKSLNLFQFVSLATVVDVVISSYIQQLS